MDLSIHNLHKQKCIFYINENHLIFFISKIAYYTVSNLIGYYQICVIGEGAICPKCKQKLTKEHISKVKDEFATEKSRIEEEVNSIRKCISKELVKRKSK